MPWIDVGGLTPGAALPTDADAYLPVRAVPQKKTRWGFSKTLANTVDPAFGSVLITGSGHTVNQANGSLVLTTGATQYTETILRSTAAVLDCFTLRWSSVLSQRIANQVFVIELVDIIGDNLAHTVNSTTSVTVTIPSNPFTADNVGQKMSWVPTSGAGTAIVLEATIASVSGNNVTFSFASSVGVGTGTGTCSLFGWNYFRVIYDGTSATTSKFQTQRNGWPSPSNSITVSTTASPGHIGILNVEDNVLFLADQVRATSTATMTTTRGQAWQDMPDGNVPLVFQIRSMNNTSPASTTTWTIAFADVELYQPSQVSLTSTRPMSPGSLVNTSIQNSVTVLPSLSSASGAGTFYGLTAAASTNAAAIKTSRAFLAEVSIFNPTGATVYVKFFNKTSAPTVGDVPILTIPVAAGVLETRSFGAVGKVFSTGLAIATTTGAAATDTTALPTAGVQISATYA